jgi:hypothetical protein
VSLPDKSTAARSRLFVDRAGTENSYGAIQFSSKDRGTSDTSGDFWLRPVAMNPDEITPLTENGELEVGTFKFNFAQPLADLTVAFFDVDKSNGTTYAVELENGTTETGQVTPGNDSNKVEKTFSNVKSITLTLGKRQGKNGDGVNVMASSSTTYNIGGGQVSQQVEPVTPPIRVQPIPPVEVAPVRGLW